MHFTRIVLIKLSIQAEAVRFEQAIVDSASKPGRRGIVQLPGVKEAMEEVRNH